MNIPASSFCYALVYLVGGISCIWSQEYECPQVLGPDFLIVRHLMPDGTGRCCVRITCNKGTYGVPCNQSQPQTTACRDCDEKDYYNPIPRFSDHGTSCRLKQKCPADQVVESKGSTYEDRQCRCDLTRGFYTVTPAGSGYNTLPICRKQSCPAGTQLTDTGDCVDCPAFTFKSENGYGVCQPFTDCKKLGLELDKHSHYNATHDVKCINTSAVEESRFPDTGPLEDSTSIPRHEFLIMGVVVSCVLVLMVVVVALVYRYRHLAAGPDNDSHGSAGERKTCLSDSSISDTEENAENSKRVIKRDHDLKVDIEAAYGDRDLKGNHTPDSGIFTGYPPHLTPSLNGGPLCHQPPPYFISNLPSVGLETDAEPVSSQPSSPQHQVPGNREAVSVETGVPPIIHIHHHYRQIGNCNQMLVNPTGTADTPTPEFDNDSYEDADESDLDYDTNTDSECQRSTTV